MSSSNNATQPVLKGMGLVAKQRDDARREVERLTAENERLQARVAELEAQVAAKPKKETKAKPATTKGRSINQILNHNLRNGETIYRSVGQKRDAEVYTATYSIANDGSGVITLTVNPADQPRWKGKTSFTSPSTFATAAAQAHNNDLNPHSINGWNVCYVIRDGKKVILRDLRVKEAAAPAKSTDLDEPKNSAATSPASSDSEDSDSEEEEEEESDSESEADVDAI